MATEFPLIKLRENCIINYSNGHTTTNLNPNCKRYFVSVIFSCYFAMNNGRFFHNRYFACHPGQSYSFMLIRLELIKWTKHEINLNI